MYIDADNPEAKLSTNSTEREQDSYPDMDEGNQNISQSRSNADHNDSLAELEESTGGNLGKLEGTNESNIERRQEDRGQESIEEDLEETNEEDVDDDIERFQNPAVNATNRRPTPVIPTSEEDVKRVAALEQKNKFSSELLDRVRAGRNEAFLDSESKSIENKDNKKSKESDQAVANSKEKEERVLMGKRDANLNFSGTEEARLEREDSSSLQSIDDEDTRLGRRGVFGEKETSSSDDIDIRLGREGVAREENLMHDSNDDIRLGREDELDEDVELDSDLLGYDSSLTLKPLDNYDKLEQSLRKRPENRMLEKAEPKMKEMSEALNEMIDNVAESYLLEKNMNLANFTRYDMGDADFDKVPAWSTLKTFGLKLSTKVKRMLLDKKNKMNQFSTSTSEKKYDFKPIRIYASPKNLAMALMVFKNDRDEMFVANIERFYDASTIYSKMAANSFDLVTTGQLGAFTDFLNVGITIGTTSIVRAGEYIVYDYESLKSEIIKISENTLSFDNFIETTQPGVALNTLFKSILMGTLPSTITLKRALRPKSVFADGGNMPHVVSCDFGNEAVQSSNADVRDCLAKNLLEVYAGIVSSSESPDESDLTTVVLRLISLFGQASSLVRISASKYLALHADGSALPDYIVNNTLLGNGVGRSVDNLGDVFLDMMLKIADNDLSQLLHIAQTLTDDPSVDKLLTLRICIGLSGILNLDSTKLQSLYYTLQNHTMLSVKSIIGNTSSALRRRIEALQAIEYPEELMAPIQRELGEFCNSVRNLTNARQAEVQLNEQVNDTRRLVQEEAERMKQKKEEIDKRIAEEEKIREERKQEEARKEVEVERRKAAEERRHLEDERKRLKFEQDAILLQKEELIKKAEIARNSLKPIAYTWASNALRPFYSPQEFLSFLQDEPGVLCYVIDSHAECPVYLPVYDYDRFRAYQNEWDVPALFAEGLIGDGPQSWKVPVFPANPAIGNMLSLNEGFGLIKGLDDGSLQPGFLLTRNSEYKSFTIEDYERQESDLLKMNDNIAGLRGMISQLNKEIITTQTETTIRKTKERVRKRKIEKAKKTEQTEKKRPLSDENISLFFKEKYGAEPIALIDKATDSSNQKMVLLAAFTPSGVEAELFKIALTSGVNMYYLYTSSGITRFTPMAPNKALFDAEKSGEIAPLFKYAHGKAVLDGKRADFGVIKVFAKSKVDELKERNASSWAKGSTLFDSRSDRPAVVVSSSGDGGDVSEYIFNDAGLSRAIRREKDKYPSLFGYRMDRFENVDALVPIFDSQMFKETMYNAGVNDMSLGMRRHRGVATAADMVSVVSSPIVRTMDDFYDTYRVETHIQPPADTQREPVRRGGGVESAAARGPASSAWQTNYEQVGSGQAVAGQVGSGQAGSGQAVAGQVGSGQAGSGQAVAGQAGSVRNAGGVAGGGAAGGTSFADGLAEDNGAPESRIDSGNEGTPEVNNASGLMKKRGSSANTPAGGEREGGY